MTPTSLRFVLVLAAAAAILSVSTGTALADEIYTGFVVGVIVIGDQLYKGGDIEMRTHDSFGLVSIHLAGEPVAVMFWNSERAREQSARPGLVLRYDARGYRHLVGVRWTLAGDPDSRVRTSRPVDWALLAAATSPGLATITLPSSLTRPSEAVATR
jgi:hypothetical protein